MFIYIYIFIDLWLRRLIIIQPGTPDKSRMSWPWRLPICTICEDNFFAKFMILWYFEGHFGLQGECQKQLRKTMCQVMQNVEKMLPKLVTASPFGTTLGL